MSEVLHNLQDLVVDQLAAQPEMATVAVLAEYKSEIENEIARSLGPLTERGGKSGICAIVFTPAADVSNRNLPGAYFDPVRIIIHVEENTLVNMEAAGGTLIRGADLAVLVVHALNHWIPVPYVRPLLPQSPCIAAAEPLYGDRAYDVRFTTAAGSGPAVGQVATPTASPSGGAAPQTVTLGCATAGASIWYSLAGAFPSPTAGTLYTGPIAVAAACTLRARAWLAGYKTSEELRIGFP